MSRCPKCGGLPLSVGYAHQPDCPALWTNHVLTLTNGTGRATPTGEDDTK